MEHGIYKGDCMDLIPKLGDGSIDCCITDPPYGIAYQSARRIDKQKWKPKILNDETPFTDWIKPLFDKMKDGGRVICFYRWDVQDAFFLLILFVICYSLIIDLKKDLSSVKKEA